MSNQDKLTIMVRITGIYFAWQTVQLLLATITAIPILKSQGLLDIFSGGVNSIMIIGMIFALVIQSVFCFIFLKKAKTISEWIIKDIKNISIKTDLLSNDSIPTVIKIIGLVLFVVTLRDIGKSFPAYFMTTENPFNSVRFLIYAFQILFPLALIFRAKKITDFIQKFSK